MAKIDKFDVPYPDFKLGEMIDPEQFDANNNQLVDKTNEIIESMNNDKLDKDGDFVGTWFGFRPGEMNESINGGRLDALEPKVAKLETDLSTLSADYSENKTESNAEVESLKKALKNAQMEISNLNLYTDANNRVKNGYSYGTNFDASFNMDVDYTKSNATSNLSVGQTIIPVKDATGFTVGQEITIYDDVNLERVKISAVSGTNLTITALTKEFKMSACVARTMAFKDDLSKVLVHDGFSDGTTKGSMFTDIGKTQVTPNGTSVRMPWVQPPTPNQLSAFRKMSVDMDLNIPYYDNVHGQHYIGKTLVSFMNSATSSNGFALGFTADGNRTEGVNFGKNNISNFGSVADVDNTLYFAIYHTYDRSIRTLITAQKGFLKEFVDKTVNIKMEIDLDLMNSAPASALKLYLNDKLIPFSIAVQTGTPSGVFNLSTVLRFFHCVQDSNNYYTEAGFGYISKFILYKDLSYTTKLLEYLLTTETATSVQIMDTSGNNYHMSVPLPAVGTTPYITYPKVALKTIPLETNDIRYKVIHDSNEVGAWVVRDEKLTAVEGFYGEMGMTLQTSNNEDQFIASRETVGPTELRLTFKKSADSSFPRYKKIIGGVY